jgi:hypothetical protein
MTPDITDFTFVWSFAETSAHKMESLDWFGAESDSRLLFDVREFINSQLDEFYAEFSESFNLANYPDVEDQFSPEEVPVFRRTVGMPLDAEYGEYKNYNCFAGLCAVIRERLKDEAVDNIRGAAELFNWTIDVGMSSCPENAGAFIEVGSVADVAPLVIERILNRLAHDAKRQRGVGATPSAFAKTFGPIEDVLKILEKAMKGSDWTSQEVALELFYWIAGKYRSATEAPYN